MKNADITSLIEMHRRWTEWFLSLVLESGSLEAVPPEQIRFVADEHGCELGKLLDGGRLELGGAASLSSARVLNGTFHAVAALLLQAIRDEALRSDVLQYQAELARISDELLAVLRSSARNDFSI